MRYHVLHLGRGRTAVSARVSAANALRRSAAGIDHGMLLNTLDESSIYWSVLTTSI